MNLVTKESELVLAHDDYDVSGSLIYSNVTNDAIGVYDEQSDYGRYYFDAKSYKFHKRLDKSLPKTENYIVSQSKDELVYVGIGIGKNGNGLYTGHGLGNRLNRIWKSASKNEYVPLPKYDFVNHIRTISFEGEDLSSFWLAAALEVYLIQVLKPEKNLTYKV